MFVAKQFFGFCVSSIVSPATLGCSDEGPSSPADAMSATSGGGGAGGGGDALVGDAASRLHHIDPRKERPIRSRHVLSVLVAATVACLPLASAEAATVCSTGADYTDGREALLALEPGGEVLFCRGETHALGRGLYELGNLRGALVGAYGEGPMPIITSRINFENGPTIGLRIEGLHFRGAGTGPGIRMDDGTSDITITNCIIENYGTGIYVKKRIGTQAQRNISIRNSVIRNNVNQGFLGGGPNLYIGYNTFENNGENGVFDHNIYFGCGDPGTDEPCPQIIEHNHLQGASRDSAGRCQGTEIVVHDYVNGAIIRNNVIREPGGAVSTCYGIFVTPGYPIVERMSNVTITDNHICNAGRVGVGVDAVDGVQIAGNTVYHTNGTLDRTLIGIQVRSGNEHEVGGNLAQDVLVESNVIRLSRGVPIRIADDVVEPITERGNDAALGSDPCPPVPPLMPPTSMDAGMPGPPDAGAPDAGAPDAGAPDAGPAPTDGAPLVEAGSLIDADRAEPDASPHPSDAGSCGCSAPGVGTAQRWWVACFFLALCSLRRRELGAK